MANKNRNKAETRRRKKTKNIINKIRMGDKSEAIKIEKLRKELEKKNVIDLVASCCRYDEDLEECSTASDRSNQGRNNAIIKTFELQTKRFPFSNFNCQS